ncbi:MAG: P-II family nitrogen regulator [Halanaerobacter sp.]
MKMIRAIIRPKKTDQVLSELDEAGFPAVTKVDVTGRGKQRGVKVGKIHYDELPKEMLLIVVEEDKVEEVKEIIIDTARTTSKGEFGDGKIFISTVDKAYTISSSAEEL